jgi:undecaprenyl-phosphate 4-deoxy-4-formamido-L-arabinose transferase
MIMLFLGMLGEYIGRIYISLNNAPQFVVRETMNIDGGENEKNTNS